MQASKAFRLLALTIGIGSAGLTWAPPVFAEIKDYQIRRLVLFKSDCKLDNLARKPQKNGGVAFHATCKNLSFYPDGLHITCKDPDLETSCKIVTEKKEIDLEFLKKSVNTDYEQDNNKSE